METVLASGKGKSCYLDIEGEQRLWDEFSIHLGCEDADGLYMCVPDGRGTLCYSSEGHISFPCRGNGGQTRPGL